MEGCVGIEEKGVELLKDALKVNTTLLNLKLSFEIFFFLFFYFF